VPDPTLIEGISSDHVTDAVAAIRLQRQEIAKQPDAEAWRRGALAALQKILLAVEEAMRVHGPIAEQLANAEALKAEMSLIRARTGAANPRAATPNGKPRWRGPTARR
jgi:hypothetical protein